jgi:outer membrane protein
MKTRLGLPWLWLLVVLLTASGAVSHSEAQEEEPYRPPVLNFDEEGIGLVEAVRLTLQHDPNIRLQDQVTVFQKGVAQEQTGAFDFSLLGNLSYEYRQQELSESRKKLEQEKRDFLDEEIARNEGSQSEAEELLAALRRAEASPPGEVDLPDPELQAQLLIIDALINQAEDPAARQELFDLRTEFLDSTISQVEDGLVELISSLEETRLYRQQIGDAPDDEVFYTGALNVQLSKLFRNGIGVAPFFEGTFDGENFKGKPRSQDFGGKGIEDLFTFRVGVSVAVPLARGRGGDATGAAEKAAQIDYDGSLYALKHQSSVSVLSTVLAYWDLRASQEIVDAAARSVGLQSRLVELTEALIEADEMPQADLARVQASQARSQARLEDARRNLHEARVNLATVMGITVTELEGSLPLARDAFPGAPDALPGSEVIAQLMRDASDQRQDIRAALASEDSSAVLEKAAETDVRPKVDVVGKGWYTSLGERTISRVMDRWVGPSASIELDTEIPFGNNFFRGRLAQRQADYQQRRISSIDLVRQIKLAIVRTARSLEEASERVRLAQESFGYYQQTIESEIEKLKAGESTLIDTILTEDQQTDALIQLVLAQQELAKLVAQLRYESGILVSHEAGESIVSEESLKSVPSGGSGSQP